MIKLYTENISDLHAHTLYSDGNISIRGSIERRIKMIDHIEEIGVSDHFRAVEGGLWKRYVSEINVCKGIYNDGRRRVMLGVEVMCTDIERLLEQHYRDLDYLIVEDYEDFATLDDYVTLISRIKQRFKGIIIMAHSDILKIYRNLGKEQFSELLAYLNKSTIPLEISVNRGYWFQGHTLVDRDIEKVFYSKTIEMALMNQACALVSLGTDAHCYEDELFDLYQKVMWILSEME